MNNNDWLFNGEPALHSQYKLHLVIAPPVLLSLLMPQRHPSLVGLCLAIWFFHIASLSLLNYRCDSTHCWPLSAKASAQVNRCSCFSTWKFLCPSNFSGLVALWPQLSDGFKLSCEFAVSSVWVVEMVGAGLFLAFYIIIHNWILNIAVEKDLKVSLMLSPFLICGGH